MREDIGDDAVLPIWEAGLAMTSDKLDRPLVKFSKLRTSKFGVHLILVISPAQFSVQ